ncbi:MAG: hypothetical protein Q9163_001643 [Psora crenata]
MIRSLHPRDRAASRQQTIASLQKATRARDLERQWTRRWVAGQVYSPHDLSAVEMEKRRQRHLFLPQQQQQHQSNNNFSNRRRGDVFDVLGINPLDQYKNFSIMAEFCTPMGRIKHRRETGLRAVNQRKIAKAIRRSVGMGLMPSVHKHPEVLEVERREVNKRWFGERGWNG